MRKGPNCDYDKGNNLDRIYQSNLVTNRHRIKATSNYNLLYIQPFYTVTNESACIDVHKIPLLVFKNCYLL